LLKYFLQKEFIEKSSEPEEPVSAVVAETCQHENPEKILESEEVEEKKPSNAMKITRCPHVNRKHYAKNMCSSCYRKFGRN